MLVLTLLLMTLPQFWLLSTTVGQEAIFQRQIEGVEMFGGTVTDEMVEALEGQISALPYTMAVSQVVFVPVVATVIAGILLGVFSMILAGETRFKQVFAVVVHTGIILGLQQLFAAPLNYARGEIGNVTTVASLLPMLDPDGALAVVLDSFDFFRLWWLVNLAIGLSVLYNCPLRTAGLLLGSIYGVVVAVVVAFRLAF